MGTDDEKIRQAVLNTKILRPPKRSLSTFGVTNVYYYLVSEPTYTDAANSSETVLREGKVIAQRPKIVTPYYLSNLEGFSSEARKYFDTILKTQETHNPGLFYTYKNEPKELSIISDNLPSVVDKLNADIDKSGDPLTSIVKGEDTLWDVSLLKFIFELTRNSIKDNVTEMGNLGLLNVDSRGVPADARLRIDGMFRQVERGELEPADLKAELDRWGIFEDYQDRFLRIFKKRG